MNQTTPVLKGLRRELTRELFEELGSLQCGLEEILGYIGTNREALEKWCRRVYGHHLTLEVVLRMLHQDGLIAIRRASFEQLRKSATLVSQQYNRFLPHAGEEDAGEENEAVRQFTAMLGGVGRDEVEELFDE